MNRDQRYICIHGHFYQPPRENPWLEEVESQDSAFPYHDWNQKVHKECYAANLNSRLIDSEKKITKYINNYTKISFDFGPTLLSWMERHKPKTYQAVIKADKKSRKTFSGHGGAIAQCYNHMIMPLANLRDKKTQVIWGVRDFEYRFERKPEGMWLPETAVDTRTLEIIADEGIKFIILSPHQAEGTKKIGSAKWKDVKSGDIDVKIPYLCRLRSGRSLSVFFYDGPVSREIAFGSLLKDGNNFRKRLISLFSDKNPLPQLVHVATDGETFGHHHKFGNMTLSFCLDAIERDNQVGLTVYGEYLEKFKPEYEARILENSSWSCSHGVERWMSDCGCCSGLNPAWNQAWRVKLREAMDWLRDELIKVYQSNFPVSAGDPWQARDEYIRIVLDSSGNNVKEFFKRNSKGAISKTDKVNALKLLEMQRNAMLMFTSCAWFFDDISRIEAVQNMRYAARAMQIAGEFSSVPLEDRYTEFLFKAASNVPELKNGALIYKRFVKPSMFDCSGVKKLFSVQE